MDDSLRALVAGLFDFAGLFGPANLPMPDAVKNDRAYRRGSDAWMMGRFVVPASRADEIRAAAGDTLPPLSVVIRGDAIGAEAATLPAAAYESALQSDLVAIGDAEAVAARVREIAQATRDTPLYLEAGWPGREPLRAAAHGVARVREEGAPVALKLRCGGLEAAAFPSTADLAAGVVACRDAGIPFKATAGLHHPFPTDDEGLRVRMHGFVNLFGGAALASTRGLDEATVVAILEDDDPASFRFGRGRFGWGKLTATADEIREARETFAISIGSCSFDEPREDLRALGLLPGA